MINASYFSALRFSYACFRPVINLERLMKFSKAIFIGVLLLFLSCHSSLAGDRITWLYSDFPPIFIDNGPLKGKGFVDYTVQLLISELDDFDHDFLQVNAKRTLIMLKTKKKVCYPALLKTSDREEFIEFSTPSNVMIPNCAIVPESKLYKFKPYLNKSGEFLFEEAIAKSNLKVGVSAGRSYGGPIDNILSKYQNNENILENYDMQLADILFTLMNSGKIDYVLGWPTEGQYYQRHSREKISLVCLPIKGMPEYILGYLGLPKNDWGRMVVSRINAILDKNTKLPEYHSAYEFWLDDISLQRYRKFAKEVYPGLNFD